MTMSYGFMLDTDHWIGANHIATFANRVYPGHEIRRWSCS